MTNPLLVLGLLLSHNSLFSNAVKESDRAIKSTLMKVVMVRLCGNSLSDESHP